MVWWILSVTPPEMVKVELNHAEFYKAYKHEVHLINLLDFVPGLEDMLG